MRLYCDRAKIRRQQKKQQREKAWKQWHLWFAWYPVKIEYNDCRWLEYVERRFDKGRSLLTPCLRWYPTYRSLY